MKSLRRPHTVPAPGCRQPSGGRVGWRRADPAQRTGPRLNVKGGALPPGAHAKGMGTDRPRTDSPANPEIKRSPCLACGLRRGRATFTQHNPTCSTMTTCRTKNFLLPLMPPIRYPLRCAGTSVCPIGHQDVLPDAFTLHGPGGSETAPLFVKLLRAELIWYEIRKLTSSLFC